MSANKQEYWWMLEAITGKSKAQLLASPQDLTLEQQATLERWTYERTQLHKPLQYILGSVPFAGLEILLEPPILIPRPETEEIVMWAIEQLAPVASEPLRILDLCTGTGCIALALAHALPNATVVGVDIDPQAVALAEKNRVHNALSNVTFIQSDMFAALQGMQFDLIISNPPYITQEEYANLEPEVKQWESINALVADSDGLGFYQRIAKEARNHLNECSILRLSSMPSIICEVGTSSTGVEQAFFNANYSNVRLYRDMQGLYRWAAVWV